MRSYIVALIIFGSIPFIFRMPHVGLYVYSWISYMNPHRLAWGFAYDFQFAMMIGALMFIAWLLSKEPKALPITPLTALMLFFTFWMTMTTVFAMNPEAASNKWTQVMKIMVVTFLTLILIRNRTRLNGLIWVIVGSIGFFGFKGGIFAVLTGGAHRIWGPPQSLIEENNALALATIMIVPFAIYLRSITVNKWGRFAILACIPFMVFSALASYSRGALLAMCAMGGFLWLKSRHKGSIGFGIVVMVAIAITFMPQQWFDRMDTLNTYEEDGSAMGRINAWAMGLNLARDHPFLGGGFTVYESVDSVWSKYAPVPEDRHSAHSIYFEVLAYHGFVGFFAFVGIGFLAFRNCSYIIRNAHGRPDLQWARDLAAMSQVSLVGFVTGGAFLNLAFFDLYWHIVALTVITRLVFESLPDAVNGDDASALAAIEGVTSAVRARKTFLRADAEQGGKSGFVRHRR